MSSKAKKGFVVKSLLKKMVTTASLAGFLFQPQAFAEDEAIVAAEKSPVKVNVSGAPESLADNLKAHLPSLRNLDCQSGADRVERFIEAAQDKLAGGAEAMGYFSSVFKVTPARQSDCWVLNIAVEPGEPVRVRAVDIELAGDGRTLPVFQEMMASPPYKTGDVLVTQPYEDFKSGLSSAASRLGFFDAGFKERRIAVNPDTLTADVKLHFETGKRYRIGKVTVEQEVLEQRYIDRYIRLKEGDIYDSDALLAQRRLLEGSGYYKDVQVSSRFGQAENGLVPVSIKAVRNKRYRYTANIGYASDTGVRAEGGMEARWVNRKGHKLDGKFRFSQHDPAVALTYKVPLWQPEHEYASISGGWSMSDNNDIRGEKLELEFNYNRRNSSDWQQTAFISFLDEQTEIQGGATTNSRLTLLGARVSKKVSDDTLFPTQGWRLQAEVKGAHDSILSDISLLQSGLEGKYLYTFNHKGKLITRGAFGASWTNEFDELPKSLRYFAGGQSSVRGYDFESIGARDAEGHVVGGHNLIVASFEYEYPVTEKISAAAFVDAGAAFDDWDNFGFDVGVGIGARYKSPLGPVRVDLAVPENDMSDVHFYFSLGPDL